MEKKCTTHECNDVTFSISEQGKPLSLIVHQQRRNPEINDQSMIDFASKNNVTMIFNDRSIITCDYSRN